MIEAITLTGILMAGAWALDKLVTLAMDNL
jgi:hypothetical protein